MRRGNPALQVKDYDRTERSHRHLIFSRRTLAPQAFASPSPLSSIESERKNSGETDDG
jgi:hypothetical protein